MKMFDREVLFFVILTVTMTSVKSEDFSLVENNEFGTLVFVNVLFRHGLRTPTGFFMNDPFANISYWPEGLGNLVNKGKQQEYELGQWLRQRYDSLLTDEYSPSKLYVESTDVDRTLMSALSVLAGMYPPNKMQMWNSKLHWQPIPVHTTPQELDRKFFFAPCPEFEKEYKKLLLSKEIQDLDNKFSDVFQTLNNNCGQNISSISEMPLFLNTLSIENLNGMTLPEWTKGNFLHRLKEASGYSFILKTWNQKLARLTAGFLVKDMVSHLVDKADKTKSNTIPNMWMYSAHDTTIADLLNTLKVFDPQFPPFSSAVLMELRKDVDGKYFVMLFYRNSTIHEPYLLTVPGCASVCPLDKFVELSTPIIPQEWDEECHYGVLRKLFLKNNTFPSFLILACLLVLILLLVSLHFCRKKDKLNDLP